MSARDLPAPPAALFPDRQTRTRLDDQLTRALNEAGERVGRGSVMPTLDRAAFRRELAQFDFAAPRALDELLNWTIERLEHGVVHMNHPRYFGLFNPAANFPSQCADRIAGSFNPQLASSGSSPAPVEIEAHVIRAVARRAGLPEESVGHFTTSGSEANYTALLCALTRAAPRFESEGVRAFGAPVAMYTSRECQPAWFKIVHQAGIGRDALRLIGTDGQGRLDAQDLSAQIARGPRARCGAGAHLVHRRYHRGRDDRSARGVRAHRARAAGVASRRCRLGRGGAGVRAAAQAPGRDRARRLGHDRCAQVVRDHDGLRHVHHPRSEDPQRHVQGRRGLHALIRQPAGSVPDHRAVVASLPRAAAVPVTRGGGLGGLRRARGARGRGGGAGARAARARAAGAWRTIPSWRSSV